MTQKDDDYSTRAAMSYLGGDFYAYEDLRSRTCIMHRDPVGRETILKLDGLVLSELLAWVKDHKPEVVEGVLKHWVFGRPD